MKKNLKIGLVAFILGVIIFSGITGVAAYAIFANNISYTPKNSAWKVNNVEDALDSLYISKTSDNYLIDKEHRVGTWIDGKPLYQKAMVITDLPNNNTKNINIDSSFHICNYQAFANDANGAVFSIGAYGDTTIMIINHDMAIKANYDMIGYGYTSIMVTLQYTKTTDPVPTTSN